MTAWLALLLLANPATDPELPSAKPVPAVQVIPLPYDQASFTHLGRELTRYHFGPLLQRPFCYPIEGPDGCSLGLRMGHPRDPVTHDHHNSVWISHANVDGVDFWANRGPNVGHIAHERVEQYEDGPHAAWMLCVNAWKGSQGKTLLREYRRIEVQPTAADGWLMLIDLQFETPSAKSVTLGQTPFGMIGVRMAKTIGVNDGGGRILNSAADRDERAVFRKPRWVDYSGPVTAEHSGGITLMDHPSNVSFPSPFHVRNDGWMGACLTLHRELRIEAGKPLRLRYGLWITAACRGKKPAKNIGSCSPRARCRECTRGNDPRPREGVDHAVAVCRRPAERRFLAEN